MGEGKGVAAFAGGAGVGAVLTKLLTGKPAVAAPSDEKLDYLIEIGEVNTQLLARLVAIAEQLTGAVPIVLEPKILPASFSLTPESISDIIKHSGKKGISWYPCLSITWLCAAGVVTTMPFTIPVGWVSTDRHKMLHSDFYDRNISVEVLVDGHSCTGGVQLSLTGPVEITFGEEWEKKEYSIVAYIVTNNTATDAYVTLSGASELLEKSFFDAVYAPLINKLYQSLEAAI